MLITRNSEMSEIYIRVCAGNEKSLKIDCSLKKEIEKLLKIERPYTNFCFEIKGHRQASKLFAFDCSMFSYLLVFFPESPEPTQLVCASCNAEFSAAWDLCQHAQQEHSLSIYKTVNHCLSFVFKKH